MNQEQSARVDQSALPRILLVDDEPEILATFSQTLRKRFAIVTAIGGAAGLEALAKQGPFAAIVSDYAMPGMNGAEFLARAQIAAPDSVRLLLTGYATVEGTVASVNEGKIFRFLTKPCSHEDLSHALDDAVEQARLITADRALVERKLESLVSHLLRAERLASLEQVAEGIGHELQRSLYDLAAAVEPLRRAATKSGADADALASIATVEGQLAAQARQLRQLSKPGQAAGESADLCRAVRTARALLDASGALRHVDVRCELPEREVLVALRPEAIEQILVNLIRNAAEAMPPGAPGRGELVVSVRDPANGEVVGLTVQDNGSGIDRAFLPLLFEPFFTTKPGNSDGMGLWATRRLLSRCGGEIAIDSEAGTGTTVAIKLPLLRAPPSRAA